MSNKSYGTPRAIEQAIKAAAQKTARDDVNAAIQQEYFTRFLSRVFLDGEGWMLKGGAGLLARIPTARATTDLDLFLQGSALDEALAELRRLVAQDLGDFFRFEYRAHRPIVESELQPYTTGYRVTFHVLIGVNRRDTIGVDLVVKNSTIGEPEIQAPVNALDLPRPVPLRYRLYPVVDQIADKVCATLEIHDGRPSSREKDLVDLVLIATTQHVDGALLQRAIHSEARLRRLELPTVMQIPGKWGMAYTALAKSVPQISNIDITLARELIGAFINPALESNIAGMSWRYKEAQWA